MKRAKRSRDAVPGPRDSGKAFRGRDGQVYLAIDVGRVLTRRGGFFVIEKPCPPLRHIELSMVRLRLAWGVAAGLLDGILEQYWMPEDIRSEAQGRARHTLESLEAMRVFRWTGPIPSWWRSQRHRRGSC